MKELRELDKNTLIDVSHLGIKYYSTGDLVTTLRFHHLDGIFSYCSDNQGNVINLRFDTKVKPIK